MPWLWLDLVWYAMFWIEVTCSYLMPGCWLLAAAGVAAATAGTAGAAVAAAAAAAGLLCGLLLLLLLIGLLLPVLVIFGVSHWSHLSFSNSF